MSHEEVIFNRAKTIVTSASGITTKSDSCFETKGDKRGGGVNKETTALRERNNNAVG